MQLEVIGMTKCRGRQESVRNRSRVALHRASIPRTCIFLVISMVCLAPVAFAGTAPGNTVAEVQSAITGVCECDSASWKTTCTYTIFSGRPALSHLIFPMVPNCFDRYTITSSFFEFGEPTTHLSKWCGEILGIKSDQEVPERTVESFTITYEGVGALGVGTVYAALKGGTQCELFPVPGVIDCPQLPCVDWSLDGSVFDFNVRKPGTYAGPLATMTIEASAPVNISFASFGDLASIEPGAGSIAAWYATTPAGQTSPPAQFLTPLSFNQQIISIPGDNAEHRFSIWSKIVVGRENPACEYHDEATIVLELENHKAWVDEGP